MVNHVPEPNNFLELSEWIEAKVPNHGGLAHVDRHKLFLPTFRFLVAIGTIYVQGAPLIVRTFNRFGGGNERRVKSALLRV